MLGALVLTLVTTVPYTVPHCEAYGATCDTVRITCTINPLECDTVRVCIPENRIRTLRIYYWERYAFAMRLLREKDVTGREGQRDTLEFPSDTVATVWVSVVDQAGNESCLSNSFTINGRVSVDDPPPIATAGPPVWFDVSGRKHRTLPTTKGFYWEVREIAGKRRVKKLLVIR